MRGKLINVDKEFLLERYKDLYGLKTEDVKFRSQIDQLNNAGILSFSDNHIKGVTTDFSKILPKINTLI